MAIALLLIVTTGTIWLAFGKSRTSSFLALLFFVFVLLLTQQMPFNSDSHFWYFGIEFLDLHLAVQGGVKKVVWSWQAGGEEIMILAGLD